MMDRWHLKYGFQVHGGNKPSSRGQALSDDISQHPEILFNYLATEQDRQAFVTVHLTREIMARRRWINTAAR